jgi:hypothetical protein
MTSEWDAPFAVLAVIVFAAIVWFSIDGQIF